jgi:uncharacterized protein involved in copper resistance
MKFRQFLTAIMILVLASSPAMAAYCTTACMQAQESAAMSTAQDAEMMDMEHCDHQSMQHTEKKNNTSSHDHCSMAGCHATPLAYFPVVPTQFHDLSALEHLQFVPTAFSADTPPPIKPPA